MSETGFKTLVTLAALLIGITGFYVKSHQAEEVATKSVEAADTITYGKNKTVYQVVESGESIDWIPIRSAKR